MRIFISWSGERSKYIALALREWLPKVIQSVQPWVSEEDIAAGSRWFADVSGVLSSTKIGLICVTPENQHNPWLLFEAGALSKTIEQSCVCPIVFEMTTGQITGPLAQFQSYVLNRDGILKILLTINKFLEHPLSSEVFEETLDVWWSKMSEKLDAVPMIPTSTATRSTDDQLEELLQIGREQLRRENLRLESSRIQDEKFDHLFKVFEAFVSKIGSLQDIINTNIEQQSSEHSAATSMFSKLREAEHDAGIIPITSILDQLREAKQDIFLLRERLLSNNIIQQEDEHLSCSQIQQA